MAKTKAPAAKTVAEEIVTPEVIHDTPAVADPANSSGIALLSPFEKKVAEYKPYLDLKIKDHSDKKGFEAVEEARKKVKSSKVEAKKVTDEIARPFKEILAQIDEKGGNVFKDLKAIEDDLSGKSAQYKGWVEAEAARVKKEQEEKIERRFDQVVSLGAVFNGFSSYKIGELSISQVEMRSMTDAEFIDFTNKAEAEASRVRLEKAAEEERLAKEKADLEKAQKEEEVRIAKENARIQKEKDELAAAQEKLRKEQEKLAEQQRKAKEKEDADAAEKKAREAEEEAERQRKIAEANEKLIAAKVKLRTADLLVLGATMDGLDNDIFKYKGTAIAQILDLENDSDEDWSQFISALPSHFKEIDEAAELEENERKANEEQALKAEEERIAKEEEDRKKREEEEKAAEEALKPDREKLLGIIKKTRDLCAKSTMTSNAGEYLMEEFLTSLNEHESIIQTYKL